MGVVFRAYDSAADGPRGGGQDASRVLRSLALELFYKECSALKSISHPNIVEILDMGETEEDGHQRPFFVMPLLPGSRWISSFAEPAIA